MKGKKGSNLGFLTPIPLDFSSFSSSVGLLAATGVLLIPLAPYDGKWSKSMVGYGPEGCHFVVELTYNYGIGSYALGNDFRGITVKSKDVLDRAQKNQYPVSEENGQKVLRSPDGYKFFVVPESSEGDYWSKLCGMKVYSHDDKTALLGYGDNQCKLELVAIEGSIDRATAFGRIAFACPRQELPGIQKGMEGAGQTILTPLVSLDTPGKATVEVVILADPDGHEICFVGDEAFRELSEVDPRADQLLDEAVQNDKSDDWFAKKGLTKSSA
ncbi:hypothetical protein ACOMHN_044116 [Nucella lapillus]